MKDKFCVKKKTLLLIAGIFLFRAGDGTGICGNYFYKKLFILQAVDWEERGTMSPLFLWI